MGVECTIEAMAEADTILNQRSEVKNMPINMCHIAPVSYLPLVRHYPVHLLLAHLVEENEQYRNFYIDLKRENPDVFYHMDCSTFEMFKRGLPMYDADKLMEMGKLVSADSIVLPDFPKQHWAKTIEAADRMIPLFKNEGFGTFFCPQSELGDIHGLMSGFEWAIDNTDIDYIGVSILSCPIALGVNESKYGSEQRDESYRMQRYLSRWAIFEELDRRQLLDYRCNKRFHCLGMTDGPREISLLRDYQSFIWSWDSSSAIWHAHNGITYDRSPTGLAQGKCELEVDFDSVADTTIENISRINYNMHYIDSLCRG